MFSTFAFNEQFDHFFRIIKHISYKTEKKCIIHDVISIGQKADSSPLLIQETGLLRNVPGKKITCFDEVCI